MKKSVFMYALLFIMAFFMPASDAYHIKGLDKEIEAREMEIGGRNYALLMDVSEANGIEWVWDSISRRIILRKNGHEAVFLTGSVYYSIDGNIKKVNAAVQMKNGSICVPLKFARYNMPRMFSLEKGEKGEVVRGAQVSLASKIRKPSGKHFQINKIVLDAGHGGKDPGAISRSGVKEKNIILDVARRVKTELERQGIDVVMTRNSDIFVPLEMRASIANRSNADFFVSIHANASRSRRTKGFEVYTLSEATDDNARALAASENSALDYENDSLDRYSKDVDAIVWDLELTEDREISIELAGFICQEVSGLMGIKACSVKSARFYVLKGAEMPSVLVELSYLSNSSDERNLKNGDYRQKMAEGVAAGILRYKDEYERTNGFSE